VFHFVQHDKNYLGVKVELYEERYGAKIIFPGGLGFWNLEITLPFKAIFMSPNIYDSIRFATLTWLVSVVVSPVLYGLILYGLDRDWLGAVVFIIPIGAVFSVPSWLFFIGMSFWTSRLDRSVIEKKSILVVASAVLTYLAFWIFSLQFQNREIANSYRGFALLYWAVISIGIFYFKLLPAQTSDQTSQP